MMPLLAAGTFDGTWSGAERARASWVGEAFFDGYLVVSTLPRDAAAALLPRGWVLAASRSEDTGRHPVVFAAGRQHATSVLFGGLALPTDADYDEVMVAVPFVRTERDLALHVAVPRMFCGDARATWSGNVTYGFGKIAGGLEQLGNVVAVTDGTGALHLQLLVEPLGPWGAAGAGETDEALADLCRTFSLPIVGRRFDAVDVRSYFEWDLSRAVVRSIVAAVTSEPSSAVGLEPAATTAPCTGYEVRGMRWRLSWPLPVGRGSGVS